MGFPDVNSQTIRLTKTEQHRSIQADMYNPPPPPDTRTFLQQHFPAQSVPSPGSLPSYLLTNLYVENIPHDWTKSAIFEAYVPG